MCSMGAAPHAQRAWATQPNQKFTCANKVEPARRDARGQEANLALRNQALKHSG